MQKKILAALLCVSATFLQAGIRRNVIAVCGGLNPFEKAVAREFVILSVEAAKLEKQIAENRYRMNCEELKNAKAMSLEFFRKAVFLRAQLSEEDFQSLVKLTNSVNEQKSEKLLKTLLQELKINNHETYLKELLEHSDPQPKED
jgi:hypothetical protein